VSRGQRELQIGDLVEIPGQFGRYIITGAKSWKMLWIRPEQIRFARPPSADTPIYSPSPWPPQKISRKKLRLVTPVEERVADLLMGEG